MICWFIGHKLKEGLCLKCGKTICEIKGHEWIYSKMIHFVDATKEEEIGYRPSTRICDICERVEVCTTIHTQLMTGREYPKWIRIK